MKRIDAITYDIEAHLRKLESFIGILKEVKESIISLKETQERMMLYEHNNLRKDILEITNNLKRYGLPTASEYEKNLNNIKILIEQGNWPAAIDPSLICNSEEQIQRRADAVLDLLVAENLKGKRFLDYGCGKGHTIPSALAREAALVIGYDITDQYLFDKQHFASNFDVVKNNAPYDIILLHDVLDHIQVLDPVQAIRQASSVLAPNGKMYIRNHPWSSRHGGHIYLNKNLAFLHLIFDEIELIRSLGIQAEHVLKISQPVETYRHWFKEANLNIKNEFIIKTEVESFFKEQQALVDKLNKIWKSDDVVESYMEIDFVEYVLELPSNNKNQQVF